MDSHNHISTGSKQASINSGQIIVCRSRIRIDHTFSIHLHYIYSTDQMQGIRQTHLPSRVKAFVSLYKLCINMYLHQCTSAFASCLENIKYVHVACSNLHEPYT